VNEASTGSILVSFTPKFEREKDCKRKWEETETRDSFSSSRNKVNEKQTELFAAEPRGDLPEKSEKRRSRWDQRTVVHA